MEGQQQTTTVVHVNNSNNDFTMALVIFIIGWLGCCCVWLGASRSPLVSSVLSLCFCLVLRAFSVSLVVCVLTRLPPRRWIRLSEERGSQRANALDLVARVLLPLVGHRCHCDNRGCDYCDGSINGVTLMLGRVSLLARRDIRRFPPAQYLAASVSVSNRGVFNLQQPIFPTTRR
jgi:hypothetical protein